jgi:hypothetical protein
MLYPTRAGKAEILFFRAAPGNLWKNMLNLQWHANNRFLGVAIFTAILCPACNASAYFRRYIGSTHGTRNTAGSDRSYPRSFSNKAACARRIIIRSYAATRTC